MPELTWVGKDKVITHHRDVPYRVLEREYSFDEAGRHIEDNGSPNMIIHGDNLEALKALLPQYEGKVDVIYIDPPYNTGNEGWVYNDNVNDPRIKRWLGEVVGKEGEDLSRHDKWLCMMYPRLRLLHRLLSPSGAIFMSIDDNEYAHLKLMCDEIFGAQRFIADISWQRTYSTRNDSKGIPAEVEHLLAYSKQSGWQPNKLDRTAEMNAIYKNPDDDRSLWRSDNAFAPGAATHQGMVYAVQHPFTGKFIYPVSGNCWRYDQEQLLEIMNGWCPYKLADLDDAAERAAVCGIPTEEVREGVQAIVLAQPLEESRALAQQVMDRGQWPKYYFTKGGLGGIARKTYLDEVGGRLPTNFWSYDETGHTDEAAKELRAIFEGNATFDTPKPTRLVEHILKVAGGQNSLVLDSFAGSGTAAEAVLRLNAKDGGKRRFILVELGDYAESTTAERVRRVIDGYTVKKSVKTNLFEHKVTTASFKKADALMKQAQEIVDEAKARYDKVSNPSFKDGFIRVTASTNAQSRVPGLGGSFSFYELGAPLLVDGDFNPDVPVEKIREYIWFSETRRSEQPVQNESFPYYLGTAQGVAYHLMYDPEQVTTLSRSYVTQLSDEVRAESTVVYADVCALSERELAAANIIFRKIPRDIVRF